jgi:hypothetical protein
MSRPGTQVTQYGAHTGQFLVFGVLDWIHHWKSQFWLTYTLSPSLNFSKKNLPSEYQLRCTPTQQQCKGPPGNQFCIEGPPDRQNKKQTSLNNENITRFIQKIKYINYTNHTSMPLHTNAHICAHAHKWHPALCSQHLQQHWQGAIHI